MKLGDDRRGKIRHAVTCNSFLLKRLDSYAFLGCPTLLRRDALPVAFEDVTKEERVSIASVHVSTTIEVRFDVSSPWHCRSFGLERFDFGGNPLRAIRTCHRPLRCRIDAIHLLIWTGVGQNSLSTGPRVVDTQPWNNMSAALRSVLGRGENSNISVTCPGQPPNPPTSPRASPSPSHR